MSNHRTFAILAGVAAFAVLLQSVSSADEQKRSKPNILVIVADDLGYHDLSIQGSTEIPTPNIDSLAKGGVRCTNGYVSGPYCSPTRAGLLTGRYQQRFGHEFNPGPNPDRQFGLSLDEVPLPEKLRAAGYNTGMVGKWHLGAGEQFHPLKRGFDEFFGFLGGAHSYVDWKGKNRGAAILRGEEPVVEQTYLTDAFGREAVAFLERQKETDKPFFLYWTFNAVHTPLQATSKYLERFSSISDEKHRTYAAMTSAMDDAVGLVLGKLRELSLEENTLIFFISDNGGPAVNTSNNEPLRGHKAQTLEGGVRVPFFVTWKNHLPAGKTFEQPVIQLDIHATALAAAGAVNSGKKLDGVDLLPYLTGAKSGAPHEALYWRFGPQWAIRAGDWKLVRHAQSDAIELYNLRDDIGESTDLAGENPEKVKELQVAWDKWNGELVPPAWTPNRPANLGKANKAGAKKKARAKKKAAADQQS